MNPSPRKPFGVLAILAWVALYAGLVMTLADLISTLPVLAQAPVYLVLGCAWILPLKPVLRWMEAGK